MLRSRNWSAAFWQTIAKSVSYVSYLLFVEERHQRMYLESVHHFTMRFVQNPFMPHSFLQDIFDFWSHFVFFLIKNYDGSTQIENYVQKIAIAYLESRLDLAELLSVA